MTEQHLMLLRFKGGCTGSSESTFVKTPHCWKSHVTAQMDISVNFDQTALGVEGSRSSQSGL